MEHLSLTLKLLFWFSKVRSILVPLVSMCIIITGIDYSTGYTLHADSRWEFLPPEIQHIIVEGNYTDALIEIEKLVESDPLQQSSIIEKFNHYNTLYPTPSWDPHNDVYINDELDLVQRESLTEANGIIQDHSEYNSSILTHIKTKLFQERTLNRFVHNTDVIFHESKRYNDYVERVEGLLEEKLNCFKEIYECTEQVDSSYLDVQDEQHMECQPDMQYEQDEQYIQCQPYMQYEQDNSECSGQVDNSYLNLQYEQYMQWEPDIEYQQDNSEWTEQVDSFNLNVLFEQYIQYEPEIQDQADKQDETEIQDEPEIQDKQDNSEWTEQVDSFNLDLLFEQD